MRFYGVIIFVFFFNFGYSQDQDWNVALIADSLKNNAEAIIRLEKRELDIENHTKANFSYYKVWTVFDENCDCQIEQISYSPRIKLKNMELIFMIKMEN